MFSLNPRSIGPSALQIPRQNSFVHRRWEREVAVFDRDLGDTHLLQGLPAEIFETVLAAPRPLANLNAALSSRPARPDPEALSIEIDAAIAELRRLSLLA